MRLPCKAKIVAFERADGVGTLEVDGGERVRFGASACLGFTPEVGISCWLIETKPNASGPGVRAKTINLSGVVEPDRLTQIHEANRRAEEMRRAEEQRRHALGERPYEAIRERTGFDVPALYRRMESDGVLRHAQSSEPWNETLSHSHPPALLCVYDFEWLTLEDMATWEPPDYWNEEQVLVPFAQTARAPPTEAGPTIHDHARGLLLLCRSSRGVRRRVIGRRSGEQRGRRHRPYVQGGHLRG
jgi:hypothetical protein